MLLAWRVGRQNIQRIHYYRIYIPEILIIQSLPIVVYRYCGVIFTFLRKKFTNIVYYDRAIGLEICHTKFTINIFWKGYDRLFLLVPFGSICSFVSSIHREFLYRNSSFWGAFNWVRTLPLHIVKIFIWKCHSFPEKLISYLLWRSFWYRLRFDFINSIIFMVIVVLFEGSFYNLK